MRELINYSSQIALRYINGRHKSDRNKFLNLGYTFSDIAIESIIPLFINNISGCELGIIQSLNEWRSPVETEEQAQFFLHKIIVNRVEQELIRLYKEADPFFSKIYYSIDHVCEKRNYHKVTSYGTIYLSNGSNSPELPIIGASEFELISQSFCFGKTESVIDRFFTYLEEYEFQGLIPLNALVKKIKQSYFTTASGSEELSPFYDENLDVRNTIYESLAATIKKLEHSYGNKLTIEENESFRKVLNEISVDISNGGISSGLFEYLKPHMADLTREIFYDKYHSILDYLIRVFKREIYNRIDKEN